MKLLSIVIVEEGEFEVVVKPKSKHSCNYPAYMGRECLELASEKNKSVTLKGESASDTFTFKNS